MFTKALRIATLIAAFAVALPVLAGGGGFGGGGFGGGGGGFGGGGFGGMSATDRIRLQIQQQIQFTDDEWTVIQPKLQKVIDAQAVLQPTNNRRGGFGGGAAQPAPQDPVVVAQQQLALVLQDQNASMENITAKLQALRDARVKAKENLTKFQDDLKRVLTVRQEAVLVQLGYLE